jgi:hypothetical protein
MKGGAWDVPDVAVAVPGVPGVAPDVPPASGTHGTPAGAVLGIPGVVFAGV